MLIKLDDTAIYNTETGGTICRYRFNPFAEETMTARDVETLIFDAYWSPKKGELQPVDSFHGTRIGEMWDVLCEVAELQMDALRLRGFDGE